MTVELARRMAGNALDVIVYVTMEDEPRSAAAGGTLTWLLTGMPVAALLIAVAVPGVP